MSVLAQGPDNQDVIFVKGAPEAVLDKCSHVSMLSSNVTAAKPCCASQTTRSALACLFVTMSRPEEIK